MTRCITPRGTASKSCQAKDASGQNRCRRISHLLDHACYQETTAFRPRSCRAIPSHYTRLPFSGHFANAESDSTLISRHGGTRSSVFFCGFVNSRHVALATSSISCPAHSHDSSTLSAVVGCRGSAKAKAQQAHALQTSLLQSYHEKTQGSDAFAKLLAAWHLDSLVQLLQNRSHVSNFTNCLATNHLHMFVLRMKILLTVAGLAVYCAVLCGVLAVSAGCYRPA